MESYFKTNIVPNTMIYLRELYDVIPVNEKAKKELTVRGFTIVKDENNSLLKVILDCDFHPNCRLDTKEYCFSTSLLGRTVDKNLISIISSSISTYNMDTAYERPWGKIDYQKCNSMRIKWRDE